MATTGRDLDLAEEVRVAFAVDEAMTGSCRVEVGDREDVGEELTFVASVYLPQTETQ